MIPLIGIGLGLGRVPGAGGSYAASAVHFADDSFLSRDQPAVLTGVSAASTGLFSVWVKASNALELIATQAAPRFSLFGAAGQLYNEDSSAFAAPTWSGTLHDGTWKNFLASWDMNYTHLSGNRKFQVYLSDVASTVDLSDGDGSAFDVFYEELGCTFTLSPGNAFDISDAFFFPGGTFVDLTVEANRRKFIAADGKPVNPSIAIAAFGIPAIRFSGDATTYTTNQGSGGAFLLTGTALTNAGTSPSD